MRVRRALLVLGLVVLASVGAAVPAFAIRGGVEAPQPSSFLGSLQRPDSPRADGHVCGATLIAPQWALTASHCTRNPSEAQTGTPRGWQVRFGSLSVTSGGELAEVDKFYRFATYVHDGDIALLHLKDPVRGEPAALPSANPTAGTPARITGWGVTCDRPEPQCYPDLLHEADTEVQPTELCAASGIVAERDLCVGAPDGSVAATNMDSGGPALVRTGDRWTIVGTVSGSNADDQPVVYTGVSAFTDWIDGIVSGTAVPPDSPVPNLEGGALFGGCSASVVAGPRSRPDDAALLLTNGHCVGPDRPAPGAALVDQPADQRVPIGDRQGYPQATATATRLVYATMTGTDIAVFRLDKSYAQLRAEGATVFDLGSAPARVGDRIDVLSAGLGDRLACTVASVVPHLREEGYEQDDAYRYDPVCGATHGASGSPLLAPDGHTVVGIHNTGNDAGEQCTVNNPCEIGADGTVTVHQGSRYGQRTDVLVPCLTAGSRLDLTRPGCHVTGAAPPANP